MESMGPQLKSARERLGISTADAAKRLHMRTMFVEALERDDWKTVGEPVYVRGFLRNYARMLGLDPEMYVEAFNASRYAEQASTPLDLPASTSGGARWRYPWLLAALSAIALLLVVKVVWTMATPTATGHAELHPDQAAAMSVSSTLPSNESGALAAARPSNQGVDLRLELTQTCWLSVSVDGKRVVYETLPAGTVKEFHGVREITLRAGNAGGVVATMNGQPIGTLGTQGQVQDRVFAVKMPPGGQSGPHE